MQKQNIKILQHNLLSWYEKNGRHHLPWRDFSQKIWLDFPKVSRPYAVLVSEIMLQQTQVKVVLERFYFQFLKRFPTLQSLAKADESEVLKAWQGLGYYSRARNLQKTARQCVLEFDGILPKEVSNLKKLSGIGSYTAPAVACFAYDEKVSFVDGNIRRIFSRLFALKTPTQKELEIKAALLLNFKNAFHHNQALLDLGALLCTPKNPKCQICPFFDFCKAKNEPELYPQSKKILYENLTLRLVFLEFNAKFGVKKSENLLYKGLYNFALFKEDEFEKWSKAKNLHFLATLKHSFTKYKVLLEIYHYKTHKKEKDYLYKSIEECEKIALSKLSLKALNLFKKYQNEI